MAQGMNAYESRNGLKVFALNEMNKSIRTEAQEVFNDRKFKGFKPIYDVSDGLMINRQLSLVPRSKDFIKPATEEVINRVKRLVFDPEKENIVMFIIPYVSITLPDQYLPSTSLNVLVFDYMRRVYYKAIVIHEDFIKLYPDDAFTYILTHEFVELKKREALARERDITIEDARKIDEEACKEAEKRLMEKLGTERFMMAINSWFVIKMRTVLKSKNIYGSFIAYWLSKFIAQEQSNYERFAISMTPFMLSEKFRRKHEELERKIEEVLHLSVR